MHRYHATRLYLDLYMRAGVPWGRGKPINGHFAEPGAGLGDWELSGRHRFSSSEGGTRILHLADSSSEAALSAPAVGERLYIVGFDARASSPRTFAERSPSACQWRPARDAREGRDATVPSDGQWHRFAIATICPRGAVRVSVNIRNISISELAIRDVTLREVAPLGGPTS
jgi:hypothetical protein